MVNNRLQYILENNNSININLACFRRSRSTTEQVTRITQQIFDGFQNRKRSLVAYVDFTAAYDKAWRSKLYTEIAELNIPACVIKWVKALRSDRYGYVNWYGTKHSPETFQMLRGA